MNPRGDDPLESSLKARRRSSLLAALCFLFPLLWVGQTLVGSQVLLPVPLLQHISPWGIPPPMSYADGAAGTPQWNPLMWDAMAFFYPIRHAASEAIRSGHLPLWNPSILGGTPLLADVQSAVLYPLNALFWLLPVARAFGASAYLHLALAGLFMAYWLRREGLSHTAALLGAVTFAVGGWSIAWLELPNFLATAVWMPLILGLLVSQERRQWTLTAAGCGIAVGMMLLAGHIQIAFYCLLGITIYALYHAIAERRMARLLPLILGGVIGVGLAAPQLLPARALSAVSHRSTVATAEGYGRFVGGAIPPAHLAGLIFPNFFGNPSQGTYVGLMERGQGEYSEVTAYAGILPLILAIHALFIVRRNRTVGTLGLMLAVGLLLSLGTPLNALFYFGFPGFARFGSPNRALILFAFAVSGLAAFGYDRLFQLLLDSKDEFQNEEDEVPCIDSIKIDGQKGWKRSLMAAGLLALLSLMTGIIFFPAAGRMSLLLLTGATSLLQAAVLFAAAASLPLLSRRSMKGMGIAALALTLLDLWIFGAHYNLTGSEANLTPPVDFTRSLFQLADTNHRILALSPSWPLQETPRASLPPNLPMLLDVHDVGGYEGAYLLRYKEQINAWEGRDASPPTNGNMVTPKNLASPLIREMAVSAVVSPMPLPSSITKGTGLKPVTGGEAWQIYAVDHPTSRAEFYATWPPAPNVQGSSLPLRETPGGTVHILNTKRQSGYVLLRDMLTSDWQASVDGDQAESVSTQSPVQRVVRVTAKSKEVVWEYRPPELSTGWRIAGLSVLGCGLLGGFGSLQGRVRRKRSLPS